MSDYDDRGRVALWRNKAANKDDPRHNPNAPVYHGTATAHRDIREGEVLAIALWRNKHAKSDAAPAVTGKLSDREQRQEPRAEPHGLDDGIPF